MRATLALSGTLLAACIYILHLHRRYLRLLKRLEVRRGREEDQS